MPRNPSSVRSGIFRPDGAWHLCGLWFYKDSAPDGAGKDELVPALHALTPAEIKIVEGNA